MGEFYNKEDNIHSLTLIECTPCVKYYSRYYGIISEYKEPALMKTHILVERDKQTSKQISYEVICKWYKTIKVQLFSE